MIRSDRQVAPQLLALVLLMLLGTGMAAHASVAVLLEEPYGHLGGMDPAGHSAIYLDHVCAASPTELRPCRPGEFGVVVSRYDGMGKYDWFATPLIGYLYAVDRPDQIPAFANSEIEWKIRDEYRREHLEAYAPDTEDGKRVPGNWYELAGSAFDRTIYGFQVKTTPEQDAKIIALFNDRPNTTHYNGMFRNCADFDRVTINMAYPHAVRRNFLADFGLTSPKQVAHGLTKYAKQHPEVGLTTFIVHQVPGDLPRSHKPKGLAESLLTSPRYVVPITVFEPIATGIMFVAYVGNGRFAMPHEAPELTFEASTDPLADSVPMMQKTLVASLLASYPASHVNVEEAIDNTASTMPLPGPSNNPSSPQVVPLKTLFVSSPANSR